MNEAVVGGRALGSTGLLLGAIWLCACAEAGQQTPDEVTAAPPAGMLAGGAGTMADDLPPAGGASSHAGDATTSPTSPTAGASSAGAGGAAGAAAGSGAPTPSSTTGGDPGSTPSVARADGLGPLAVAPGYADLSVPLGDPLPDAPAGEWTYVPIEGSVCRDGSQAGLYVRYSDTSRNYFVFLEGGGVCFDDFFCPLNPANVNQSVDGESILQAAVLNFGGAAPRPQTPRLDGIFKNDPRNPVADWNAVYVPYCSGDVYGGTVGETTVPRWPAGGVQNFSGYHNTRLMAARVIATFLDADKALLTGSSAGGVGSLVNAGLLADTLAAHTQTRGFVVSDSGPVFDDPYLEPCIQKEWRDLWQLEGAFPPDCEGCFEASGGGIVRGLASYLFSKYSDPSQVVGGLISSQADEIMSMFFSKGLDNCAGNPLYPVDRYKQGLDNFRDEMVDPARFSTYYMAGGFHMHLFQPRYYEENGVGMSIAEWLGRLLDNEAVHVAPP